MFCYSNDLKKDEKVDTRKYSGKFTPKLLSNKTNSFLTVHYVQFTMQTHPKCADKCKKIMKSCLNQLPKLFLKSKYKYDLPSKSSTFPRSLTRRVPSNKNHTLPKCNAFGITIQSEVLDPNVGVALGVLAQMFALCLKYCHRN